MIKAQVIIDKKTKKVKHRTVTASPREQAKRAADEAIALEEAEVAKIKEQKSRALAEKWRDPYKLIDDILERGIDAVKADRDALSE